MAATPMIVRVRRDRMTWLCCCFLAFNCWLCCCLTTAAAETTTVTTTTAATTTTWALPTTNRSIHDDAPPPREGFVSDGDFGGATTFSSEVYHSRLEPFRSFPCYPKYIHLAQESNNIHIPNNNMIQQQQLPQVTDRWMINMTVSFALDFATCACAVPTIVYGGPVRRSSSSSSSSSSSDSSRHSQYHVRTQSDERWTTLFRSPLQFNYTSEKTNGQTYQSDWIYHIPLTQLVGGLQSYWYRIVVSERNDCLQYTKQLNLHVPTIPQLQQQQQRRSLRGSNGYYLGETKTYTFITPPIPGQATSLALVGDLGQTINSAQTIYQIYSKTAAVTEAGTLRDDDDDDDDDETMTSVATGSDLDNAPPISQLLIAGDLSYADSDPDRWTSFLELIEPLVRTLPLHVVAGNHEIECDTVTNELFVPYENWFRVPNRIQAAMTEPITDEYKQTLWDHSCSAPSVFQGVYNYGNSFYSFQHGLVYIIVLNSYSNCTKGSVQYEWLVSELEKYRNLNYRRATPWLLISFHAPLYTTFLGHVNEKQAVDMKDALESIFIEYGVNLVVSGHDHGYMRTYPMAYDKVDVTGRAPIYVTLGAGGNREGHSKGYRNPFAKEAWVATRTLEDFGYGHLYAPNATHARFQWVRDRTSNNNYEDIAWIFNPHAEL